MTARFYLVLCLFFYFIMFSLFIHAAQDAPATAPAPAVTDYASLRNEIAIERDYSKTLLSQQWDYIRLFIACFTVILAIISIIVSVIGGFGYWKSLRLDKKIKEIDLTFNQFIAGAAKRVDEEVQKIQLIRKAVEELEKIQLIHKSIEEKKQGEELSPALRKQIEELAKNISKTPEEDRSADDYVIMALETKDLDEKIDLYTKAIKLKPDDAIAYYFRGCAYREKGKYDLAIQNYDEAIKLEPDYIAAFYFKACVLAMRGKEGDREEAFKALEETARLGFIHIEFIREDKELISLHGDPRFDEILKKIKENDEQEES